VPRFYQQIAADSDHYGVLDLPAGWPLNDFSSGYYAYQMTHGKPIAWAYLSRPYLRYPLHGMAALWDANVTDYAATRDRLARNGYRYVVWHKHARDFFSPTSPDGWNEQTPLAAPVAADTDPFIRNAFRGEKPMFDDDLVAVYRTAR